MRVSAALVGVLMIAPAALAQERGYARSPEPSAQKQAAELAARVPFETPIKGAPYSADVIIQSTQTLADGNRISNKSVGHVFRDGEGRTRREQEGTLSVVTRAEPVVSTRKMNISIVDPVAGYTYSLNPEQKIAYRTPLATSKELLDKVNAGVLAAQRSSEPMTDDQRAALAEKLAAKTKLEAEKAQTRAAQSNDAPSKASAEAMARGGDVVMRGRGYAIMPNTPLEHATIDGLAVEGHKTTQTIPAGQIGNEQPIVITSEEWHSADLKVLVLTKYNDPRTGESTYRLANVVRAEPDPSLFIIPPDYTVKDTGIRRNDNE